MPSAFELKFIINTSNDTDNQNIGYIRFNTSSNGYMGKGSSSNHNFLLYDGSSAQTLATIPKNTDVEYTLTYQNGTATVTDGTNTKSASMTISKIYLLNFGTHCPLKLLQIKPL